MQMQLSMAKNVAMHGYCKTGLRCGWDPRDCLLLLRNYCLNVLDLMGEALFTFVLPLYAY